MTQQTNESPSNCLPQSDDTSVCKLEIQGDLAGHRVRKLENEFAEAIAVSAFRKVSLNITAAHAIDSPGIALCVGLFKECKIKHMEFEIIASPEVHKILKLVNLDRILPIKELE